MVYVSSACLKREKIKDSVEELALAGFRDIELSGGTKYYEEYEKDIFELKDKYGLNYLLHNYFPPPKEDFILNLASLDDGIYEKTIQHYNETILLARKLDLKGVGLHAGFFVDFSVKEAGKDISLIELSDRDKALKRFVEGIIQIKDKAGDTELYVENNVLSLSNAEIYKGQNPFMLTCSSEYEELRTQIDFKLLLDIAHLRVSANSLGLNFRDELNKMFAISDYVHVSENDGAQDQNLCFSEGSDVLDVLKDYDFSGKIVTIETWGNVNQIKVSQEIINKSLSLAR